MCTVKFKKKGVSPVIAVLLLIAIIVAVGVAVYVWATGYTGTTPTGRRFEEILVMDTYDFSPPILKITLRNAGTIDVIVGKVYFEGRDVTNNVSPTPPQLLAVGTAKEFTIDLTGIKVNTGVTYVVKFVTAAGTSFTFKVLAGAPTAPPTKEEEFKASSFSVVSGSYSGSLGDTYEVDGRYLSVAEALSSVENVVKNGQFEEGLKYWTRESSGAVRAGLDGGTGVPRPSARVDAYRVGSGYGSISQQIEIKYVGRANLSFYYNVEYWAPGSVSNMSATIKYGDEAPKTVMFTIINGNTPWTRLSRDITFNKTGTYELTIRVEIYTPKMTYYCNNIVHIDDVRLEVEGYYAEVRFDFNIPIDVSKITSMALRFQGYVNGSKFYIYVYNFTAGGWVYLGEFSSTSETLVAYELPPANSGVISNGVLRIRVSSERDGFRHAIYVNYVAIKVKYRA